jgi:predicted nucleic acid-binding protein
MRVKIVDASALGALVFGEPAAEKIATILDRSPLAAPSLLRYELASICLEKRRMAPKKAKFILEAFRLADCLNIDIVAVDHVEVIRLAQKKNLTTYDASYLWLAEYLDGELVTLDQRLEKAAG